MPPAYLVALVLCAVQPSQPMPLVGISPEQEPTANDLDIRGLADRLTRSVAGLDPASRSLWVELSRKAPAHATLAETRPTLPKVPFRSGTMIPTSAAMSKPTAELTTSPFKSGMLIKTEMVFEDGLPGHLSLPTSKGLRILMENEAEVQVTLDPSGISATTSTKPGKEIITWSDDVLGIKWSPTNPELLRLSDVRKALGVSGPTMDRYHNAVYWLPDDHVSFAGEVWSFSAKAKRADYIRGDSGWGNAFFENQPSPGCRNNLRTRIAPGGGLYSAIAFCPRDSSPHVALIWMRESTLRGRYLTPIEILRQESPTIPFEFVPWGRARQPLLCIVSKNRVPVLMRLSSEGAEEIAKGEPVPADLAIGAPTWCDINKDGLLEILAPVTDEAGALSIVVLLAETKTVESSGK